MNPQLLALLAENNAADLKAIVNKIGVDGLIDLMPHIVAIMQTVQSVQATQKSA